MDPRGLTELMEFEGGGLWLYRRLKAAGMLDTLPTHSADRLRTQAFEAAGLRMRIEEEAAAVNALLTGAGIPVILIKGIARSALAPRYPYLDARAMSDVDLLLPGDRIQEGYRVLLAHGYTTTRAREDDEPAHHHLAAVWNERRVAVELHQSNSLRVAPGVAWARAEAHAERIDWGGVQVLVPSATELAWSAISHGLADGARGFRLERFLQLTALAAHGAPIEWPTIVARSGTREACDESVPPGREAAAVLGWVDAALTLVDPARRPPELPSGRFDLRGLLQWRLTVLGSRRGWGRGLSGRLLEEGARALIGLPLRTAPPGSAWSRTRRYVAARTSRLLFGAWQASRRRPP